jgi:hypothetical protein
LLWQSHSLCSRQGIETWHEFFEWLSHARPVETEESAGERVGQIFMEEQNVIFGMVMSNDITDQSPHLELKQQGKDIFAESSSVDNKSLLYEIAAASTDDDDDDDGPCSQTSYLLQELPFKNFIVSNGRVFNIKKTALDTVD